MALVIEKKGNTINWFAIATAVAVLGSIGAMVYFLFFASAPLIEVVLPIKFQETATLSKIDINPSAVLNDPIYKTLKSYIADPTPGTLGRPNPFISF
ncbi:MAG: hypothetical protein Q8Q41_00460 [bacterium]|nr:hypothetical protein [bacterium]